MTLVPLIKRFATSPFKIKNEILFYSIFYLFQLIAYILRGIENQSSNLNKTNSRVDNDMRISTISRDYVGVVPPIGVNTDSYISRVNQSNLSNTLNSNFNSDLEINHAHNNLNRNDHFNEGYHSDNTTIVNLSAQNVGGCKHCGFVEPPPPYPGN